MSNFTIRPVAALEAAIVARHRAAMFQDMGEVPEALTIPLREASERALAALLANGDYVGWFATDAAGAVIAGAGVHIRPQLPRISLSGDRVAESPAPLVVNVYTEPAWRGRGVARALMQRLMSWASEEDYERVVLHASDDGRPLYVSLGFTPTNEMRWAPPRGGA